MNTRYPLALMLSAALALLNALPLSAQNDSKRFYDEHGAYMGRSVRQADGSTRYYDKHGAYQGRRQESSGKVLSGGTPSQISPTYHLLNFPEELSRYLPEEHTRYLPVYSRPYCRVSIPPWGVQSETTGGASW